MRRVLIVGASGAIGDATVQHLTSFDWRCIRSSSRDRGPDWLRIDLSDVTSIRQSVVTLPDLDGVVLCAGKEPTLALQDTDIQHVREMLELHLVGPMMLLKGLAAKMKQGSAVVMISSVAAFRGSHDPSYAAAKASIIGLTHALARAWAPNVRVNAVAPGLVADTPVHRRMTDDFREAHLSTTLLGRAALPRDCAESIRFLLESPHATSVVLHLNGGQYPG